MGKGKNIVENILSKIAYKTVKNNVNSVCPFIFYQPVLPEKAKTLKKK